MQREDDLVQLVNYIQQHDQSGRLRHYTGHDVDHVLHLLTDQPHLSVTSPGHSRKSRDSGIPQVRGGDVASPSKPAVDVFLRAARSLHYVSIAILSFLLLEVDIARINK